MPSFFKKLSKNPIKVITAPLREVAKHIPVVGRPVDKLLRETARVIDKSAIGAFNTVTGKAKINKQAEQQIQKCQNEFAKLKNNSLKNLDRSYQENLTEIQQIIQEIENEKTRLLAELNSGVAEMHAQEITALEIDLSGAREAEQAVISKKAEWLQQIEILERQSEGQLAVLAEEINARYAPLLEQCDNNLEALRQQEQAMSGEYENRRAVIIAKYNEQLDSTINQIEEHKKKAKKKATRNFMLSVASYAVAEVVTLPIAGTLGVSSKAGIAMTQTVTSATCNALITRKLEQLPLEVLKGEATKRLIGISNVQVTNILNNMSGVGLNFFEEAIVAGVSTGSVKTIVQGGKPLDNIVTAVASKCIGAVMADQLPRCEPLLFQGLNSVLLGGFKAAIAGQDLVPAAIAEGLHTYIKGTAKEGVENLVDHLKTIVDKDDLDSFADDKININKPKIVI